MFQLIEKLRQKPEKTKKYIAFFVAFILAGTIFVIWLSVIVPIWRRDQTEKNQNQTVEQSPIESLGSTFSSGISAISEQVGTIKELVSSLSGLATSTGATTTDSTQ